MNFFSFYKNVMLGGDSVGFIEFAAFIVELLGKGTSSSSPSVKFVLLLELASSQGAALLFVSDAVSEVDFGALSLTTELAATLAKFLLLPELSDRKSVV